MRNYLIHISVLFCSLFILSSNTQYAQENFEFGQYPLFKPFINNASAISHEKTILSVYGRRQWISIDGTPSSLGSYLIIPFGKNSIGVNIKQESIGIHSKQVLIGNYTHKISLTGKYDLSFGLGLGAELITSKYSNAAPSDITDQNFSDDKSAFGPEINFGLYFFGEKSFFGFSIPSLIHNYLLENNGSFIKSSQLDSQYWHYYFIGGYNFTLYPKLDLEVSILNRLTQNAPAEIDLNTIFSFNNKLGFGLSYRTMREILCMIHYNLNERYMLGYSYHSYFGVNSHVLSGHEIICTFIFSKKKKVIIQNPRF